MRGGDIITRCLLLPVSPRGILGLRVSKRLLVEQWIAEADIFGISISVCQTVARAVAPVFDIARHHHAGIAVVIGPCRDQKGVACSTSFTLSFCLGCCCAPEIASEEWV